MAEEREAIYVRLGSPLKNALKTQAQLNGRSMSAEAAQILGRVMNSPFESHRDPVKTHPTPGRQ